MAEDAKFDNSKLSNHRHLKLEIFVVAAASVTLETSIQLDEMAEVVRCLCVDRASMKTLVFYILSLV